MKPKNPGAPKKVEKPEENLSRKERQKHIPARMVLPPKPEKSEADPNLSRKERQQNIPARRRGLGCSRWTDNYHVHTDVSVREKAPEAQAEESQE